MEQQQHDGGCLAVGWELVVRVGLRLTEENQSNPLAIAPCIEASQMCLSMAAALVTGWMQMT